MITDYIHYKLESSYEENNLDLQFIKVLPNGMRYYRSFKYSELYLPNKVIQVQIYLAFNKGKLQVLNYLVPLNTFKYLTGMINSYAKSPDEVLFKDPFQEEISYSCLQKGVIITFNQINKYIMSLRLEFSKEA